MYRGRIVSPIPVTETPWSRKGGGVTVFGRKQPFNQCVRVTEQLNLSAQPTTYRAGSGGWLGLHGTLASAFQMLIDEAQLCFDRVGGQILYCCVFPPARAHELKQGAQMGFSCLQRFGTTGAVLHDSVHSADPWVSFKQPTHVSCFRWAGRYMASTSCTLYCPARSERSCEVQLPKFSPCSGTSSFLRTTGSRLIMRWAAQSFPPISSNA
jgi:hypothetical protein